MMLAGSNPALVASLPRLVDRQLLGEVRHGGPGPRLAVVRLADLVRRVGQAGLIEQLLVVVDEGRIDAGRQADLLAVHLERVDQALRDLGQVDARAADVRREIGELVAERLQAADAHGADDVRRVAGRDLGREGVVGDGIPVDLERQDHVRVARDVGRVRRVVLGVELVDDGLLDADVVRALTGAEADEPADERSTARGQARLAGDRGDDGGFRCRGRRGGRWGGRLARRRRGRRLAAGDDQHRDDGQQDDRPHGCDVVTEHRFSPPRYIAHGRGIRRKTATDGFGGRPVQGKRLPALEARRTSSVARITRRGTASWLPTESMSRRAASFPISSMG